MLSNFESFLKTGTTFAVLSTEGKTPFHFLEEIIFYKTYYFGQKPN